MGQWCGKVRWCPHEQKRASLTLRMENCQRVTPWRTSSVCPPSTLLSLSQTLFLLHSFLSFFLLPVCSSSAFLSPSLTSRLAPKRRHPVLAWTRPAASDLFSELCPSVHWRWREPHTRCPVPGVVGRARCAVQCGAVQAVRGWVARHPSSPGSPPPVAHCRAACGGQGGP